MTPSNPAQCAFSKACGGSPDSSHQATGSSHEPRDWATTRLILQMKELGPTHLKSPAQPVTGCWEPGPRPGDPNCWSHRTLEVNFSSTGAPAADWDAPSFPAFSSGDAGEPHGPHTMVTVILSYVSSQSLAPTLGSKCPLPLSPPQNCNLFPGQFFLYSFSAALALSPWKYFADIEKKQSLNTFYI